MNELTVVDKAGEWRRMKGLVLDSVRSPITKRAYNMALDEFFDWYRLEPRAGVVLHHCPHVRHPQTGGGGDRQRAADAGVGGGHRPREEHEVRAESSRPRRAAGRAAWQLPSRGGKPDP